MGAAPRPAAATRARTRLAPSRPRPLSLALLRVLGPAYVRFGLRVDSVEIRHAERLVEALRGHMEGRSRLIIAFRHPYGDEPQLMSLAVDILAQREARALGRPLPGRPHARFVHGYEVPLWSGPLVRWLLPRSGGLPVHHARMDAPGIARLRAAVLDGPCPIALAPEGQVSYRSETIPRLEQGTAQLAFWCAGDLARAGREESVLVLPVSLHVRYDQAESPRLLALLSRVEGDCGLPAGAAPAALPERLRALDDCLLGMAADHYGLSPSFRPSERPGEGQGSAREARRAAIIEEALSKAEAALGLRAGATGLEPIDRVYRIRQEGWDRIYPETIPPGEGGLARRLADRRAGEAWYAMRHMELVDLLWYLDEDYLWPGGAAGDSAAGDGPSFGRLVETAYSLADLSSRLTGGDISDRPNVMRKAATLVVAQPIEFRSRLEDYRRDRRAALRGATAGLRRAYEDCIEEYLHGQGD